MTMWTREELKDKAKKVLSQNYLYIFGATCVALYIIPIFFIFYNVVSLFYNFLFSLNFSNLNFNSLCKGVNLGLFGAGFAINYTILIFLFYPIQVGLRRYIVNTIRGEHNISDFWYVFKNNLFSLILVGFLSSLYIFLFSLLLFIPGLIKSYEYRMIPYIVGENPEMSFKEAASLSKRMTDGQKMDIFILDISFLGWSFLSALCAPVGVFFVTPYINVTEAELYLRLKENI